MFELVGEREGKKEVKPGDEEVKEDERDPGRVLDADIEELKKLAA